MITNPAKNMYSKALSDVRKKDIKKPEPVKKTGLLQRNMQQASEESKGSEPYNIVLDAMNQIITERKKLKNVSV
tara:strand:+ start:1795 stop:2016 length:222 start_codon:yes stop_codon:yes gene_type:complete